MDDTGAQVESLRGLDWRKEVSGMVDCQSSFSCWMNARQSVLLLYRNKDLDLQPLIVCIPTSINAAEWSN